MLPRMPSLSSLVVDLQVNAATMQKGLNEANKKLEDFGKKVDKIGNVVSLSMFAGMAKQVATGLTSFVMAGAQAVDQTGKLAQSAGSTTEAFSRLQYAARLSGISGQDLAGAMGKLNKNLAEAGAGAHQQAALFQALGIKVKDSAGNVRGADTVLGDLAERFAGMKDGASKSALAMEVFGKSGAQLIPFLNSGRAGLSELAAECDRLGITITEGAAKGAERFNDNLEKLHMAVEGVAGQVAANLAPSLANLTDVMLRSDDAATGLKGTVEVISTGLRVMATMAVRVAQAFRVIGVEVAQALSAILDTFSGNSEAVKENWAARTKEIEKINREAAAADDAIWGKAALDFNANLQPRTRGVRASADAILAAAKRGAKGLDEQAQAVKSLERTLADLEARSASFGQGPLAEFEARLKTGDLAQLLAKAGEKADELREKLRAAFGELDTKRLNEVVDEIDHSIGKTRRAVGRDATDRRKDMASVGMTPREKATIATGGFGSFEESLGKLNQETMRAAEAQGTAQLLHSQGQHAAAREQEVAAEAAQAAADRAGEAAEGFKSLAEIDLEEAAQRLQKFKDAVGFTVNTMLSKMGEFGSVVSAGIQGFQSAGIWGAIFAVIADLLSRFQGFQQIIDMGNGFLKIALEDFASGFTSIIEGLKPLLGAIGMIMKTVHGILNPILSLIGELLGGIAPFLAVLGLVMQPLGSLLKSICGILGAILKPILQSLTPVFLILGLVMLTLQLAVTGLILAIVTAGDELLKAFGNNSLAQARNDANQGVKDTVLQMEELGKMFDPKHAEKLKDLADESAAAAQAKGKETKEVEKTTTALAALTAQFTNMPQGFRTALAQYQSMDPVAGAFGSIASEMKTNLTINVQGSVLSEGQLMDLVERYGSKRRFRKYGTPVPP